MSDTPVRKPTARSAPSTRARKPAAAAPAIAARKTLPAPVPAAAPAKTPVARAIAVEAASVVADTMNSVTQTVAAASKPAAPAAKENTMDTIKPQAMLGDLTERAKAAFSKSQGYVAEMNEFNKANIEALVESSKIAASGLQTLAQDTAEFGRKSFEQTSAAFKGMAQVKSPTELAKLHTDYVRSLFDAMVAETSRNTEAMLKLAGEVAQPISNRFAVAAEKVKLAA